MVPDLDGECFTYISRFTFLRYWILLYGLILSHGAVLLSIMIAVGRLDGL